ncbi:MAG: hypothetical protein PWQ60_626 [Thermoanaerobacteraceae bacterium]|nr:hypothetical protein [Thermoanaerobacteraceae bacterium]
MVKKKEKKCFYRILLYKTIKKNKDKVGLRDMGRKSNKKQIPNAEKAPKYQAIPRDGAFKNLIFALLAVFIMYPPFFRGLFFDRELLPTEVGIFVLFVAYLMLKSQTKTHILLQNPLEFSLAAFVLVYVISVFAAVNLRLAIGEAIKYFMYFAIFLMVSDFGSKTRYRNMLVDAVILSAFGVAIVGIASAVGTVKYNGAFVQNMISSTLQYHNAFGALMLCAIFLCFSRMSSVVPKFKVLYQAVNFALFFGYIFSFSRGAWVLFPPLAVLYLILTTPQGRLDLLSGFAGMLIGAAVSGRAFYHIVTTAPGAAAWGYFFLGLVVSIIAYLIAHQVFRFFAGDRRREIIGIATFAVIILAVVLIFRESIMHLIPQDLLERFSQISLETQTASERFVFYKDAFKIIKEHPIFGIGGGGWSSVYFMYQSYLYWTTQTHNYIFQVWIEAGTVGLLSLIAVIVSLIYVFMKVYKTERHKDTRIIAVGAAISYFALLSHSFIDFDLSLASLSIFLWTLMGLINSFSQASIMPAKSPAKKAVCISLSPTLIMLCYILLAVLCTSLFNGYLYGQKAVASVKTKDMVSARKYFESAAKYDPFMSSYKADLASVLNAMGEQQKSKPMLDRAMQFAENAVDLDPYNSKILASAAKVCFAQGKIEKGLEYIDRSVKVQPLNPVNYQQKAQAYIVVADYYLKNKNIDEAKQLLNKIKQIPLDVEKINKTVMKPVEINDETKKIIQQAEDILKTLQ